MEVHVMRRLGKDCPNLQRLEEYLHCGGDFPMYFQILPCADGMNRKVHLHDFCL